MGQPYTFNVAEFCSDFVTGAMWENLTGGAGNSKTWVPDNGKYGMKQGYYSCFGSFGGMGGHDPHRRHEQLATPTARPGGNPPTVT